MPEDGYDNMESAGRGFFLIILNFKLYLETVRQTLMRNFLKKKKIKNFHNFHLKIVKNSIKLNLLISNNSTTNNFPIHKLFFAYSPSTIKNPLINMNFRRWRRGGGGRRRRGGKGENNSTTASNEWNKCKEG